MSGPFYGALAASASVFVAILTALLVNNYIQIKSERRQLTRRINQVKRDLKDLREDKGDYQSTVDEIRKQRQQESRKEAEDNVDKFIDDYLSEDFHQPIENLTVDDLYDELLDYYGYASADELEEDEDEQHHKGVLEDRKEKIEDLVLNRTVRNFAAKYEDRAQVENPLENDDADFSEEEERYLDGVDFGMDLEDFVEKYKQRYEVDDLDDRTEQLLEKEYNEVVAEDEGDDDSSMADAFPPTEQEVVEILQDALGSKASELGTDTATETLGDLAEEERRERQYENARDNLVQTKSEIESLERTKSDLEQQKEGQHPEDLKPTLYVNAATIFLSVVVPMAAYLDSVTEFTITQLSFINIWMIGGSWLLGLIIVFVALYCRIENEN